MKHTLIFSALLSIIFLGSSFTTSHLDNTTGLKSWVKLGTKKANYALDRDVIYVGRHGGSYSKLKLHIKGGGLNMHSMVVKYGDGSKDRIPLVHNFRRGSDSRIIDLEGRRRKIKDITFLYDTKNMSRKKATITVWGKR